MAVSSSSTGVCEFCGSIHAVGSCPALSQLDFQDGNDEHREPHMAFQSLPRWVQVQQHGGEVRVVATKRVQKLTRLGPLLAPHIPNHQHPTTFPLKICHDGGSFTYLDLSRKWLCNWLSLIQVGSQSNRNLLACQIDDLIYYMADEDIAAGSELRVWYAPFYQQCLLEELKSVTQNHDLLGASVVTRKLPPLPTALTEQSEPQYFVAPNLVRISVGQGQVMFTHRNKSNSCPSEETNTTSHPPNHILNLPPPMNLQLTNNKCSSREFLVIRHTATDNTSDEYICSTLNDVKRKRILDKPRYNASRSNNESEKSILIEEERCSLRESNCVVSLTISSTRENIEPDWSCSNQMEYNNLATEDWQNPTQDDTARDTSGLTQKGHKRKNKKELRIPVADSDVVKQLPARALGAHSSLSWSCQYCESPNFHSVSSFADHLKGHMLWLLGRRHVCGECSKAFSTPEKLQQHLSAHVMLRSFVHSSERPSSTTVHQGKRKAQSERDDALSDEESVDPSGSPKSKKMKKVVAIPTEVVDGPHNCQICWKSFEKAAYFLRHLRKHSGDFTCKNCLKVFTRKENLLKHMGDGCEEEKQLHNCNVCQRGFINQKLLDRHMLKHKEKPRCTHCGWTGTDLASLQRHVDLCPSVQVSSFFECNECGKQMTSLKQLERHEAHHRYYRQCHLCNKTYHNSTYLAQHISVCRQIHELSSVGRVSCEDCGQEFTDATTFRIHYHTHTHPFLCTACNRRFQARVGYELHVCDVEQHCDECGKAFRSVKALNRHSAIHRPPPHFCSTCRRSYFRKESLDRHVCHCATDIEEKPKEKEQTSFPCHICGSLLATKYSFTTHMRTAHGEGREYELMCEVCGKGFQRRDLLQQHRAVHAPPSFPCPTCNKLFKSSRSLELHSLIHLNIKTFTCKYCNKQFYQKANLSRHERSHFPRGSVKCQYCATQCSSTENLKAHLLSHTLLQPKQEILKGEVPENEQELASLTVESENLTEKGRMEPKENMKVSKSLNSDYSTEIVHAVVPVITSEIRLHSNPIPNNSLSHHQTVFLPQRISLNNDYIVSTQSANISSASQNIGNSSVFKVTNKSSSVDETLPSTVLITTSPVSQMDTTHLDQTGQMDKISHFEGMCLYQTPSSSSTQHTPRHQTQVLSSDHIVKSVVLMAQPPSSNC